MYLWRQGKYFPLKKRVKGSWAASAGSIPEGWYWNARSTVVLPASQEIIVSFIWFKSKNLLVLSIYFKRVTTSFPTCCKPKRICRITCNQPLLSRLSHPQPAPTPPIMQQQGSHGGYESANGTHTARGVRRAIRPCDACRRRKTRCVLVQDATVSRCVLCRSRGLDCTFGTFSTLSQMSYS